MINKERKRVNWVLLNNVGIVNWYLFLSADRLSKNIKTNFVLKINLTWPNYRNNQEIKMHFLQDSSFRDDSESSTGSTGYDDNNLNNTSLYRTDYYEAVVPMYSNATFKSNFGLKRTTFNSLMTHLKPLLAVEKNSINTGEKHVISNEKKVLMTIYFLTKHDTFKQIAQLFNISEGTAQTEISYIVDILFKHSPKFIKWPKREEANINEQLFFNKGGLSNVLGCIDGAHITLLNSEYNTEGINRKVHSTMLLQGVVNYHMQFIDVYCGEFGTMHDSRLLKKSGLYNKVQEDSSCMYGHFLLGDSAYTCHDWLVPPFKNHGRLTTQEHHFNQIHSLLRARVETAFGILKGRFRRLQEFQNMTRPFIIKATISAIVLHNICLAENDEAEIVNDNRTQPQYFEMEDISPELRSSRRQQAFIQLFQNSS